jgi:hypothetical protein
MSLLQTNGEEETIQRRQFYTTSESQTQFPQSPSEGGEISTTTSQYFATTPGSIITLPKEVFGISLTTVYKLKTKTTKMQTVQYLLKRNEMIWIPTQNNAKSTTSSKKGHETDIQPNSPNYIHNIG